MDGRTNRIHGIKQQSSSGPSVGASGSENGASSNTNQPLLMPITSAPPYWRSSRRTQSQTSLDSSIHGGITLNDNETGNTDRSESCWARSAVINEHVVVNGNRTGIGAFVVWIVVIETLTGSTIQIRKRYSEFDKLRDNLLMTFPLSEASMPPLPPKGLVSNFRPRFLEKRRQGLQYFLNCILLNPEFASSPVLKDFLFE